MLLFQEFVELEEVDLPGRRGSLLMGFKGYNFALLLALILHFLCTGEM